MIKNRKNLTYSFVLALVLSFIGGMLEAYSLTNRGFFALMQTGNTISVFINLVKGDWNSLIVSLVVVLTFIFGLFISNIIEYWYTKKGKDFKSIELIIAVILLIIVIFIPVEYTREDVLLEAKDLSWPNVIGNMLLSLIGSMLLESFSKMNSRNFTATMMTANYQRMVKSFFTGEKKHDKEELISGFDYLFIVLCFGIGVAISYFYFYYLRDNFVENAHYWIQVIPNLILILPILVIIVTLVSRKIYLLKHTNNG